ncbi:hypothetical protein QYN14_22000 [Rhodococcus ruber]|uniref:hypothetical protein n=1 Tax=Rhodococcus ruber TaxID=1830 RepID=UPI002657F6FA|nr:hypothetical protein [Rhodococcus ruber]WKK11344.1 hypothetical protein QYN14_22000 [Rhodococcus ruber]
MTPPLVLALVVTVAAGIPVLSNRWFYYWDDSAAQFTGGWYTVGEHLLSGSWPVMLPDMWAGGNFAAEALFGIYNPVLLAQALLITAIPNMAVAALVVKTQFLVLLAVGVYVLARQYGASQSMAFVAGSVLPFAGYTLYFDASSWASGLVAFAWIPHVWWSTRALALGRVTPLVPVLFGWLAMTTGNPYGAVGVAVVYVAVAAECLAVRRVGLRALCASGLAVVLMALVVYLPLAGTTGVSVRTETGISNDGSLRAGLGDVVNLSAMSDLPFVSAFGSQHMSVPLVYLAWFIVPLAPWIRWSALRSLKHSAISLAVFGGIYAVLLLGPSNLWFFRWPARLLGYAQLPLLIAVAVALSAGLRRDHLARRAAATVALVLFQSYLSWSNVPDEATVHAWALVVALALTAAAIVVALRAPRLLAGMLAVGSVVVLGLQTNVWFTGNFNVTPWRFVTRYDDLRAEFEHRYQGTTFVIAHPDHLIDEAPRDKWDDILFGNAWRLAGVDTVNSYAGISYNDFVNELCLNYYGGVPCGDAVDRLLAESPGTGVPWVDAMRLNTVVLQNSGPYGGPNALARLGEGWSIRELPDVTVARRDTPLPWPDGRLAAATPGLHVRSDVATGETGETVEYTGSGTVTFAFLAWPGWSAHVDGTPVEVSATAGGLLQVHLPESAPAGSELTLSFTPPGTVVGWLLAGLGLLVALIHTVVHAAGRRRRTRADAAPAPATPSLEDAGIQAR